MHCTLFACPGVNCAVKKWVVGKEKEHCTNWCASLLLPAAERVLSLLRSVSARSYCYVCDDRASSCPSWASHCKATHEDRSWVVARAQWKLAGGKNLPVASARAGPSSAAKDDSDSDDDDANPAVQHSSDERWSCSKILKAVEQIFPIESTEPEGFAPGLTLRPYQKQSLGECTEAFALEADTHARPPAQPAHPLSRAPSPHCHLTVTYSRSAPRSIHAPNREEHRQEPRRFAAQGALPQAVPSGGGWPSSSLAGSQFL